MPKLYNIHTNTSGLRRMHYNDGDCGQS